MRECFPILIKARAPSVLRDAIKVAAQKELAGCMKCLMNISCHEAKERMKPVTENEKSLSGLQGELDKLDVLILNIFKSAPNGLTLEEATASVCEWVARSNDPELQCLADADPAFSSWRKLTPERLQ